MSCTEQPNTLFYKVLTCAHKLDISEVPLCPGLLPWRLLPDILTLPPLLFDLGGLYFCPLRCSFISWFAVPHNIFATGPWLRTQLPEATDCCPIWKSLYVEQAQLQQCYASTRLCQAHCSESCSTRQVWWLFRPHPAVPHKRLGGRTLVIIRILYWYQSS